MLLAAHCQGETGQDDKDWQCGFHFFAERPRSAATACFWRDSCPAQRDQQES